MAKNFFCARNRFFLGQQPPRGAREVKEFVSTTVVLSLVLGVPYNGRLCTTADYVQRPVVQRPLYNGRWTTALLYNGPMYNGRLCTTADYVQRP